MSSGLNGITSIIPPSLQGRIEYWSIHKMTGQIALNFMRGRILNFDIKEHGVIPNRCSKCMVERDNDDRGWVIVSGQAFCGRCNPL